MIDIDKSYFHNIAPLYDNHKKSKSVLENTLNRLNLILELGYLYPGKELTKLLQSSFPQYKYTSSEDCIYLAQSPTTELPSLGKSFKNGEFSAFMEHIQGKPSLVFGEEVTKNKKIKIVDHFLSEEICLQDKISIEEIRAIALPYKTPIDEITYFINFFKSDNIFIDDLKDKYISNIMSILNSKERKIKSVYDLICKWQTLLDEYNLKIPLIRYDGTNFCLNEELSFLNKSEDKVKTIIKAHKR